MQLKPLDVLAAIGMFLFVLFAVLFHFDRFVEHRGRENVDEFFFYAFVLLILFTWAWVTFRRYDWDPWLLALVAFGLLLHFAGGLTSHDGVRLYDWVPLGIRFDKIVHFVNAAIAAQVVVTILRFEGISLGRLEGIGVVLMVLGVGTIFEIAEWMVLRFVPDAGVGQYNNNLQDLIANLCGSVFSRCVLWTSRRMRSRSAAGPRFSRSC